MSRTASKAGIFDHLFADPDIQALFSDAAAMRAMLAVEAALARAQGVLGMIPQSAAEEISNTANLLDPDATRLGTATDSAGVPVIALVTALRGAVSETAAPYVHWGATSQDIMDTGLVLVLERALDILLRRMARVGDQLAALADENRATLMAARTRTQQAVPTTFGLKAALWLHPLARHCRRLDELRPRLLAVQLGGAGGTQAAWGGDGPALSEAVARALSLAAPAAPWHGQRDGLVEFAGWLALVSGSLGKIGADLTLMAQSEVGEIVDGAGGSSSTMPQKANPIRSETLVALARSNAGLIATMHQALIHNHERDGMAWPLEWLTLTQMAVQTGAALAAAEGIFDTLEVRSERMAQNLEASNGLLLAEAAAFALAAHMPRAAARDLVARACADVAHSGRHLIAVLSEISDAAVDWQALEDPANYLGSADQLIDSILAEWRGP